MTALHAYSRRRRRFLTPRRPRNHNLEEQAQALYKSWFVDFEPFKDGRFVDSELGMIPESWKIKRAE
ncbi:MAG: restriction endonuclease subunit S, partial [Bacteroidales bacterium]|nr:restriction endonuclease subunit S [Bacteroidales bacterium]